MFPPRLHLGHSSASEKSAAAPAQATPPQLIALNTHLERRS
jgi:hypothetical protein